MSTGAVIATNTFKYIDVFLRAGMIILLLFTFVCSKSQHQILKDFNASIQQEEVRLNWIIKGGYQCNGIVIQRSTDTLNFKRIGEVAGICGGAEALSYSFIDTAPLLNQKSYYRLILGNQGPSAFIGLEVFHLTDHLTVLMNPAGGYARILFANPTRETYLLSIYDAGGRLIKSMKTNTDNLYLYTQEMQSGLYILKMVSQSGILLSGKLIVR